MTPKVDDSGPLEAICVRKYTLDANDVQKYFLPRDRFDGPPSLLAMRAANDLIAHLALLLSLQYAFPHNAREYIVNFRDAAARFIWYAILAA